VHHKRINRFNLHLDQDTLKIEELIKYIYARRSQIVQRMELGEVMWARKAEARAGVETV
jgi:Tfp pilus assembly pilus retraction ATPase PilT